MKVMRLGSKEVLSWCLYDWANSAFSLTVMAAFFPGFFKAFWSAGVDPMITTARLGFGNALGGVIVVLLSPLLGALAGAGHLKKKFMVFFIVLGVVATSSLAFVPKSAWVWAMVFFLLGRTAWYLADLFYNAFLLDITTPGSSDFVSSLGFSCGYIGSALLFIIQMLMYNSPTLFHIADAAQSVRVSFFITGLWWVVFSIPLFMVVRQREQSLRQPIVTMLGDSFGQLVQTGRTIVKTPFLALFLVAYWFYIDGVNTVILMATDFGLSIGIPMSTMLVALLVVQFVAFPSSIIFALIAKKIGTLQTILITIVIYIFVSVGAAWFIGGARDFILFGIITGLVQGSIQALSRSFFARQVPIARQTEYFGFYNMVGKSAMIGGPALIAGSNLLARFGGIDPTIAARAGIASVSLLFIAGALILGYVVKHQTA